MSERQLLRSHDARADERLEKLFGDADEKARIRLVSGSLDSSRSAQHPALLRLGLRDGSELVRRAAAERAAADAALLPPDLLGEAARILHDSDILVLRITEELINREDIEARRRGLLLGASREPSAALDLETWTAKLAVVDVDQAPTDDEESLDQLTVQLDRQLAESSEDTTLRCRLARAYLDLSRVRLASGEPDVTYLWDLAHEEAQRAAAGPRALPAAHAIFARTDWLLGGQAASVAPEASRALPGLFGEARSTLAAETLDVLVQARAEQAFALLDAGALPESGWIADIAAGAQLIVQHPLATPWQRGAALDVIGSLQLDGLHAELAWLGVRLHPEAPEMHEQLRWHLMRDGDATRVSATYDALLPIVSMEQRPTVKWFAAFAQLHAGDRLRDERRLDEASASYRSSLQGFGSAVSEDASLTHTERYVTLAHSGLARILLDRGEAVDAAKELLMGLESDAQALDIPDSLGVTPRSTTVATRGRLLAGKPKQSAQALVTRLDSVLAQ